MTSPKLHHLVTLFAIFVLTLSVAILPEQVQAASNPFSSFTQSISERWNGLMLKLPGNKSGRSVLAQSLAASQKVTSADISWQVKAEMLNEANTSLGTFNVAVGGPATFKSGVSAEGFTQQSKFSFEAMTEGVNTKASGEMFIKPDALYVKVTELPDLGELLPPEALSQVLNQWVLFPTQTAPQTTEQAGDAERTMKMSDAAKKLVNSATISQAKREKLDGKGVFVIDVVVPDDALLVYIQDVEAAMPKNEAAKSTAMSEDDKAALKRFLDGSSELKAVMYVDDSNYLVRKMVVPLQFDLKAMKEETGVESVDLKAVGVAEEPARLKLDIVSTSSRFNEKFNLQPPTEFVPFSEFMGNMMPASGAMTAPKKMPARPAELPELTEEEKEMLKAYGLEVKDLY